MIGGRRLRRNVRPAAPTSARPDPLSLYTQRMDQALDLIDAQLEQAPGIGELAAASGFVLEHFHRCFSAWMGERLKDYWQRRRIEVAALHLAEDRRRPILQVARELGYKSAEDFTPAFKARFALPPAAWRAQLDPDLESLRIRRRPQLSGPVPAITLTVLPAMRIAYLRHHGRDERQLAHFRQTQFQPWLQMQERASPDCFVIDHDDPELLAPEASRFDIGIVVREDFTPRGQAGVALLPGGRYALARHTADTRSTEAIRRAILRDWLPGSGLQLDNRPLLERHAHNGQDLRANPEEAFDILLPVKPL